VHIQLQRWPEVSTSWNALFIVLILCTEGFQVTLLEKETFPRYHIGESMLPSARSFLKFIDAEDKVKNFGFTLKVRLLF
jgi:hypothetical protein